MIDPDVIVRILGIDPEKQRERQRHSAEMRKIEAEIKQLRVTRYAAWGGLISGLTALCAFLVNDVF